jgi:hypothetical protein
MLREVKMTSKEPEVVIEPEGVEGTIFYNTLLTGIRECGIDMNDIIANVREQAAISAGDAGNVAFHNLVSSSIRVLGNKDLSYKKLVNFLSVSRICNALVATYTMTSKVDKETVVRVFVPIQASSLRVLEEMSESCIIANDSRKLFSLILSSFLYENNINRSKAGMLFTNTIVTHKNTSSTWRRERLRACLSAVDGNTITHKRMLSALDYLSTLRSVRASISLIGDHEMRYSHPHNLIGNNI